MQSLLQAIIRRVCLFEDVDMILFYYLSEVWEAFY